MTRWVFLVVGLSGGVFTITGVILGLEFLEIIRTLSIFARAACKVVCVGGVVLTGVILVLDIAYSYSRAKDNKQKLKEGIEMCA